MKTDLDKTIQECECACCKRCRITKRSYPMCIYGGPFEGYETVELDQFMAATQNGPEPNE